MGKNGEAVFAATCNEPLSLNAPCSDTNAEPLLNYLKSPFEIPVDGVVENEKLRQIISNSIDSVLTEREALVIRARYGIAQQSDHILADIGRQLEVSPERVRIIQRDALHKLKKCLSIGKIQENYA